MTDLSGQIALVTGGTAGIGATTCRALADAGATVALLGRNEERGNSIVEAIERDGGTARFGLCDVRDADAIDAAVDATIAEFGRLDIAFNNAGIFDRGVSFEDYDDAAWGDMLATNLTGVFVCMRAELRVMVEQGSGSIVNNASPVAHAGTNRASPGYVAAKHGVMGLTRQAAQEYASRGIRVNAVSPGPTDTDVAQALIDEGPDVVAAVLAEVNPMGRFVSKRQVAETVVFLCSPTAAMINGQDIVIDGGQLAKF